jgi:broad specificity phosphatase PhoE
MRHLKRFDHDNLKVSLTAPASMKCAPLIKIYLARHGETTWNAEGRIQGQSDPELSPRGYRQSLILLEQIKKRPLSAIYTSSLQRSILTDQPVAQYFGLPIQRRSELNEIAFGILEGRLLQVDGEAQIEWERFKNDRLTYRIPGAENYQDVAQRLKPFLTNILSHHQDQEILVVGHRVVNQLLIGMLLNYPMEIVLRIEQANDLLYLVQVDGETRVFHYLDGEIREGVVMGGKSIIP